MTVRADRCWSWGMPGVLALTAVTLVVFGTTLASIAFTVNTTGIAAIWPVNAVLLVALLRVSPRAWPAFLTAGYAATAAANIISGGGPVLALALPACNIVEVLLSAVLLYVRFGVSPDMTRTPELASFAVSVALGSAISASLAAGILTAWQDESFAEVWQTWFLADALGMLVFAPPLLAIRLDELSALIRPQVALRGGVLLLLTAALTIVVFAQNSYPLLFLVFPALVLVPFALGCAGAALATFLVAALATGLTAAGHGPIMLVASQSVPERVLLLQGFLAAVVLVAVPVATALAERQRLARSVIDTQHRLDNALASMGDGLALYDAQMRLVLCNRRYQELFPRTADLRVPGVLLTELLHEAVRRGEYDGVDARNIDEWISRHLAFKQTGGQQEVALANDRWIDVSSHLTTDESRIFVCRDVTERKQLERTLEVRNGRLEAMNTELDQFASMAAHDLRAPLRQVGVLCEWLTQELGEACPETARGHLEQIRRRVRRMSSLVEGLRQYACAGGKNLPVTEVALGPLAAEAAELAGAPEGFTVEIDPDLPTVIAPEAAIALVLRNLVGNAVKHHDRAVGRVRVRATDRPAWVEITVEDDGPGIPEDQRERVFDLFARFSGDATEPGGVGLALVRRTAAVHLGRAWITPSGFGRGTAVHVAWAKPLAMAA